jgi:RimJ/RimL family protein N-acetyltransferase
MFDDYPRETVIKDGTIVIMRPLERRDEAKLCEFFAAIPDSELWFLRDDLADPDVMRQWMEDLDYSRVVPMIALTKDEKRILANLRIHRRPSKCLKHVAHLRIIIHPEFRGQRLGTWMLLDSMKLSLELGLEKLLAEFVAGIEEPAINAAHKLDFFEQAVLKDYVMDPQGSRHNLIIMVKNLHSQWSDF